MVIRLPREHVHFAVVTLWLGRGLSVIGLAGLVIAALTADLSLAVLGGGVLLLGIVWMMRGAHRRRRPARYVAVDAAGANIKLVPEGAVHSVSSLGDLTILEWGHGREDAFGTSTMVNRATVFSPALELELYESAERGDSEAWLARFKAAVDGVADEPPLTALDQMLETRAPLMVIGSAALTVLAAFGVTFSWTTTDAAPLYGPLGVGFWSLAAVNSWSAIEWPRIGGVLGVGGALVLLGRPFMRPLLVDGDMLDAFAEAHLGYLIGAALLLIGSLAVLLRPATKDA